MNQAKTLADSGVTWHKEVGLCCNVDSRARTNTTQFNGYYGCGFCLHPGKLVDKVVKYLASTEEYSDRTNEEMVRDMELALEGGSPAPLINLPYFDVVWGFVPDYMHAVLLEVSRQITRVLDDTSSTQPYYVGSPATLREIDARIVGIQPPHLITQLPRGLSNRMHWKTKEWKSWLLFYSLPCLEGFLPKKYLQHLGLLVTAIYLLLKD